MKIIERLLGNIAYNKLKMFIENNLTIRWLKYIFTKWDTSDKFILALLLVNLFIFSWLFSFIFALIIDYFVLSYIKKLGKK
jgi:hypothetical protein